MSETGGTKRCSRCKTEKPLSEFRRNNRTRSGFKPECKACGRARGDQWRAINEEKLKLQDRTRSRLLKEKIASSLTFAAAEKLSIALRTLRHAVAALEALVGNVEPAPETRSRERAPLVKRPVLSGALVERPAPDPTKPPPIRTIPDIIARDRVKPREAKRIQDAEVVARAEWKPPISNR